jgi:hypothetical protein
LASRSPPGTPSLDAQERSSSAAVSRIDRDELMRALRTLSQSSFEGRRTGTPGNRLARRFIHDTFQQIGLAPAGPDFLQPFSFVFVRPPGRQAGLPARASYDDAANVLAMEPGRQAGARTHRGVGALRPPRRRERCDLSGADDNASGVAAMLAIARYVHARPPRPPHRLRGVRRGRSRAGRRRRHS